MKDDKSHAGVSDRQARYGDPLASFGVQNHEYLRQIQHEAGSTIARVFENVAHPK